MDVALGWLTSYINRSFSVVMGDASSSCAPLFWGVPQGLIWGPILFHIYKLPFGQDMQKAYHWLKPGSTNIWQIITTLFLQNYDFIL